MSDLSEFLSARLDEVEALATAATPGRRGIDWTDMRQGKGGVLPGQGIRVHIHDESMHDVVQLGGWNVPPPDGEEFYIEGDITGEGGDRWFEERKEQALADADHIAAHDPAFTLAWVEALRRVVAEHGRYDGDGEHCRICQVSEFDLADYPCDTLRALASAFKAHPEWREEWA